jgi:hypothetical protein
MLKKISRRFLVWIIYQADVTGSNRHVGPDSASWSINHGPPRLSLCVSTIPASISTDRNHDRAASCSGHPVTYPPRGRDPISTGVISNQDKEAYL